MTPLPEFVEKTTIYRKNIASFFNLVPQFLFVYKIWLFLIFFNFWKRRLNEKNQMILKMTREKSIAFQKPWKFKIRF